MKTAPNFWTAQNGAAKVLITRNGKTKVEGGIDPLARFVRSITHTDFERPVAKRDWTVLRKALGRAVLEGDKGGMIYNIGTSSRPEYIVVW